MLELKKTIAVFLGTVLAVNAVQPVSEAAGSGISEAAVKTDIEDKAITDVSRYEDKELIVIYKDDVSKKEKKQAVHGIDIQERNEVTDWCDKITLKNEDDLVSAVESVAENEDVFYVQPNFHYSALGTVSSAEDIANITETDLSKQWWVYNDGTFEEPQDVEYDNFWPPYGGWFWPFETGQMPLSGSSVWDSLFSGTVKAMAGIDTNTAKAWQKFTTGGRKTVVAVIDTGIDYTHSQLKDSIWVNSGEIPGNGIDDDGNGYIDDVYGWDFYYDSNQVYVGTSMSRRGEENEDEHGTHVAGVITAAKDGSGIAGIASNTDVELMCLKVLGGKDGSGDTESIVKAIAYAEAQGAVICNMSFGINETDVPFYYQDYDKAMKEAVQKSSMLFVTAAGNDGKSNDSYGVFPSSYDFDNVIAVGNLRCDGTLSTYSNYGEKTVDLAAPGMYIYSTVPDEKYEYMSGTSMATPMVTAACAMGYAYAKNPDVLAVRERVLANVTKLEDLSGKLSTGGMLNVYDAVADLAEHEYSYVSTNTSSNTENTGQEMEGDSTGDSEENHAGTDAENTEGSIGDITGNKEDNSETPGAVTDTEEGKDAVGKQFIQNGTIYKILSHSTAAATGVADSSASKIVVESTVTYEGRDYKVTEIRNLAFYKNQSVVQIVIGENVKTIGNSAFIGCKKLKKVTGMAAVKKIKAGAFKNCRKLKSVILTENVKTIAKSAFAGCQKLKVKTVKGCYAARFVKKLGIRVDYQ